MSDNSKTAFQIGAESLGKIVHPRKHTQGVDANQETSLAFHKEFMACLEKAKASLGSEVSEDFSSLIEEARFSDPVGNELSASSEQQLLVLAYEVQDKSVKGEAVADDGVIKMRRLLAIRNSECMQGK